MAWPSRDVPALGPTKRLPSGAASPRCRAGRLTRPTDSTIRPEMLGQSGELAGRWMRGRSLSSHARCDDHRSAWLQQDTEEVRSDAFCFERGRRRARRTPPWAAAAASCFVAITGAENHPGLDRRRRAAGRPWMIVSMARSAKNGRSPDTPERRSAPPRRSGLPRGRSAPPVATSLSRSDLPGAIRTRSLTSSSTAVHPTCARR